MDFDFVALVLLQAGQHFQAAPAAGADDRVVGIGDLLQLVQDEAGHDQHAFDEIGLDQVGDAAVNNNAGVQQQEVFRLGSAGRSARKG